MKTQVFNLKGESVGEVNLPANVFEVAWKPDLVKQVMLAQAANARSPWAHTKNRAEVSGGGKKPWKQKGTGRARHGSIRSPIWRGGGTTHGPNNLRDYSQKVNSKMKVLALHSALSKKAADGELKVIDSLALENNKTKQVVTALHALLGKKISALLVPLTLGSKNLYRACRNIPRVRGLAASALNVVDLLSHKNVLIDKNAIAEIK